LSRIEDGLPLARSKYHIAPALLLSSFERHWLPKGPGLVFVKTPRE